MMSYLLAYWLNLILATLIAAGTYYLAVNEVKMTKRFLLVFLSMMCAIEVTILFFYIPWSAPADISPRLISAGVTLLFAKLVLKPALLGIVVFNIWDQRQKIRKAMPHGQKPAVLPQPLETVQRNQVAAALGKIDQAIDTARDLDVTQEATRKLTDSQVLRERPAGAREESA